MDNFALDYRKGMPKKIFNRRNRENRVQRFPEEKIDRNDSSPTSTHQHFPKNSPVRKNHFM
ncbi:hypothetical protein TcasGA2_TC011983 [Tribolium castaneum]|uniref:Uncharacterized protein n=1 Tax=Tribolium castaneum TaxID=7070 RepID=D6X2Q9_TRICA|nr:hypothetical protein TcasGA2_TC011983 [Tribolium castaneum]